MTATTVITYRCPHCQQPVDVDVRPENELLLCPNEACKKPFKVEVPTAEPVSELVLPPGAQPTPLASAPVPAAPVAQPASEMPEETLRTVGLSMFRRYPLRCLAYLLVVAVALAGLIAFAVNGYRVMALLCTAAACFVSARFVHWWLRMRKTTVTVTTKRCLIESGIFTRQAVEMPLDDVKDVLVRQNFVLRWFGVGDLELVGKKGEAHRLVVMAVRDPEAVAGLIRDRRVA